MPIFASAGSHIVDTAERLGQHVPEAVAQPSAPPNHAIDTPRAVAFTLTICSRPGRTRKSARTRLGLLVGIAFCAVVVSFLRPAPAAAIPVFARIYDVPCGACHTVFPQLNPAGEHFRARGLHGLAPKIEPIKVGSAFEVPGTLPLALYLSAGEDVTHLDAAGESASTRSQFNLEFFRLLAGGELGRHLSFLVDYEFVETDPVTGEIETLVHPYQGFLNAHADRWGWLGNVKGGWYEQPLGVSPVIHRLSVRKYLIYGLNACSLLDTPPSGTSCEDQPVLGDPQIGANLGALHAASGFGWAAGMTNGANTHLNTTPASPDAHLHLSKALGPHKVGFFAYYSPDIVGSGTNDRTVRFGPDLDLYSRRFRVLGQFLAEHESNPTGNRKAMWYYGGFLETNFRFTTTLVSLLRMDYAWNPRFDDRSRGGDTHVKRRLWELTGGWQWLIRENLKAVAEVTYGESHEAVSGNESTSWRATLRLVTAFWPLTPPGLAEWTHRQSTAYDTGEDPNMESEATP